MSDNPFSAPPKTNSSKPNSEETGLFFGATESSDSKEPQDNSEPHHEIPENREKQTSSEQQKEENVVEGNNDTEQGLPAFDFEERTCRSCQFYGFEGEFRGQAATGLCRRNAPAAGSTSKAVWPTVDWQSWCGEWACGVSDEDMAHMARSMEEEIDELSF